MKKMQGPTRINHGSSVVKLTPMQLYFLSQIFDKAKVANHHPMQDDLGKFWLQAKLSKKNIKKIKASFYVFGYLLEKPMYRKIWQKNFLNYG